MSVSCEKFIFPIVVSPSISTLPNTERLSLIVVKEVVCPIFTAMPLDSVPSFNKPVDVPMTKFPVAFNIDECPPSCLILKS